MPLYEISWTIDLQTNDESALEIPFGETALTQMYPPVNQGEGVNIYITADGGRLGQISMSQRVFSGDAKTARMYLTSGNPFASQEGMVAVINNSAIDVAVSSLTVVDMESGTSVVMDVGHAMPDTVEVAPTVSPSSRRRRGRPRTKPVVEETTTGESVAEEESAEEESAEEESAEEESAEEESAEEESVEEESAEEESAEEESAEEESAEEEE
jgi:hypothetical protein